jgi:cyclic beta-1,2-glucan synthetase
LRGLARLHLNADGRPLQHHVQDWIERHEQAFEERKGAASSTVVDVTGAQTHVTPTQGTFDAPTGEFRFDVSARSRPLRPWINVLANPGFGAQLSESGAGYSWAVNSRLNQLTAWSNDPVGDQPSEWFLLQDLRTMQAWSVAPSAWSDERVVYRVAHGQGYSVISHQRDELEVSATWCVDPQSRVKQIRIRLLNRSHRRRNLRVVGLAEWMMGANRSDRATVRTAHVESPASVRGTAGPLPCTTLLATQREHSGGFGYGTAFLSLCGPPADWTCDRRECFDARGQLVLPDFLGQRSGDGLDPCAALARRLSLGAGESTELVFLLGHADGPEAARELADAAAQCAPAQRMDDVRAHWDQLLGATTVQTPDPLFDLLVNRWLLYQTLACRLWAKAGFYQAGGAFGFCDQLQDAMGLVWAAPDVLRRQILLAASRQFAEGDVQHWWHAPTGAGVRTHFSDDLLWLGWACLHYLRATGDAALLDETCPFLEGVTIAAGAEDAYDVPGVSAQSATVFEHAARAIDHSLRVGVHGLPLMGSGDWNDGMNRVGHEGRGESVWLGWFLCALVDGFAPLARRRGETARAEAWEQSAHGWRAALDGPAWDGAWYRRAFFDDGHPLGSQANEEGRIDLIAQAWSVLSGVASQERQGLAMAAVEQHLVDRTAGLIRLLDPPLVHALPSAGYIQAYPPGVRENGGQYSHGAVWALMAQARRAVTDPQAGEAVYRYFTWLSPAHRAADPVQGPLYGLEPYVMAGDICSQPPYAGRGGWSWYTGAAAWMHRAAIESVFGLDLSADELVVRPCLPAHWPVAELHLTRHARLLCFIFMRQDEAAALAATANRGAQLLLPGAALQWRQPTPSDCWVIPLGV